ncbi:MAG: hypothetical protein WA892_00585 [Ornithinimicrobium sp.]
MSVLTVRGIAVLAHVTPTVVSLMLLVTVGAALPGPGLEALAGATAGGTVLALTPWGERAVVRLFLRSKAPTLFQRYTLAPVAHALLRHGVPATGSTLLVTRCGSTQARYVGRRTVVVTTGLIEALARRRLSPEDVASVIAHEVGVSRAGLTRYDAALLVLLAPWRLSFAIAQALWAATSALVPRVLRMASLWIMAGACLWLGYAEDPKYLLAAGALLGAFLAYKSHAAWVRTRNDVGDAYLHQCRLANQFSSLLLRSFGDAPSRDRAIRLRTTSTFPADLPAAP